MKKINKIISALASLTVAVAALTGCPSVNADSEALIDLSTFYLRGNMNNWANDALTDGALTENDDGTFSITYTAKAAEDEFAIADSGWAVKYCNGTSVAVDGTETEFASGGDNAKVTGQIPGNNYKMTITPGSSSLKIKVELAGSNSASFYIVDAVDGLVPVSYDGSKYTYDFTATGTTESFELWSEGKYYTSNSVTSTASVLTVSDEKGTLKCSGLTSSLGYILTLTVEDGKVSAKIAEKNLKDVYELDSVCSNINVVDGSSCDPITWSSDDPYTGTVTFKKGSKVSDWGGGVQFAVAKGSWGNKFTGAEIASADTLTSLTYNSGTNAKLTAVTDTTLAHDLVITIVTTGTEVKVKYTYSD